MDMEVVRGMEYGSGFNSLKWKVRGNAVQGVGSPANSFGTTGAIIKYRLSLVEKHSQLSEFLQVSASASMSGFGFGSASAKMKLLNESTIDIYSIYILVQVQVMLEHLRIQSPSLTTEALHYFQNASRNDFVEKYGDLFVIGMTQGGELTGLIRCATRSEKEKSKLKTAISASGAFGSWSASGASLKKVLKITEATTTSVQSEQSGGSDTNQVLEVDKLIAKAETFPSTVPGHAVAFIAELQDYDALSIPTPFNFSFFPQMEFLRKSARNRSDVFEKLSSANAVLEAPEHYEDEPELDEVAESQKKLQKGLEDIDLSYRECMNDTTKYQLIDVDDLLTIKLPPPKSVEPKLIPYEIRVKTSAKNEAGTNSNVTLEIEGDENVAQVQLTKQIWKGQINDEGKLVYLPIFMDPLEEKKKDVFVAYLPEIGIPTKLTVSKDDQGTQPGWHLKWIRIQNMETKELRYFSHKDWIGANGKPSKVTLKAQKDAPV